MDTNIKIQGIKAQIDNMRLQIENIVTQNYNIMNSTGDQLLILSMQMLNTGIQTFNVGKSLSINLEKYYEQLEKISNQIANLINMNYMHKQQQMMEQQIIQQQMIQQQIMQQQMMEQQKMQQPMIQQQIPLIKKINIILEGDSVNGMCLIVDPDITTKELHSKCKERFEQQKIKDNNFFWCLMQVKLKIIAKKN